jgi:hypothetical protein
MNRWSRTKSGDWSIARIGSQTEATKEGQKGRKKIGAPTEVPGTLAQLKKDNAHTDPAAPWLRESPNPSARRVSGPGLNAHEPNKNRMEILLEQKFRPKSKP